MLFVILWVMGMIGVISAAWVALPVPAEEIPIPLLGVRLIGLIQPTFLLLVAVFAGVNLTHGVGLSASFAEALASNNEQPFLALKPQIIPGIIGGVAGCIVISTLSSMWQSSLPTEFVLKGEELLKGTPLLTRILYGGITEEIMTRWGLMTSLVWVAWRVFQKGQGTPHAVYFVVAIGVSALVFGALHLPLAFVLSPQITPSLVTYIILGNSLFGLIAGYLYWRWGLESAIIAHMMFHILVAGINSIQSRV